MEKNPPRLIRISNVLPSRQGNLVHAADFGTLRVVIVRNVEWLRPISAYRFALGAKAGTFEIRPSDSPLNLGVDFRS